ncbi:hypothetical protein AZA_30558 [Nitrospirillum viridazoti Y2]|nr:hypothetical protein AZA_30558 [Nitrospirillum amazonense Y2]
MQHGDDGHRQLAPAPAGALEQVGAAAQGDEGLHHLPRFPGHGGEIQAGAEGRTLTAQDDGAYLAVAAYLPGGAYQAAQHGQVHAVQLLRPRQTDVGDGALDVQDDPLGGRVCHGFPLPRFAVHSGPCKSAADPHFRK